MHHPQYFVAVITALLLSSLVAPLSQAGQAAPLMPLASRSLLLDMSLAGSRIVVTGERGHVLFSEDNGNSWTQASVPTTQMLTGIHFVDERRGWAAGHDGQILASDDGGETWRLQRNGLSIQHQANLEFRERAYHRIKELEAELEMAPEEGLPELQMQMEDAQLDLEDADIALSEPVHTAPFMDIWFQDENRGWAVGAFGTLAVTTDGGQQWRNKAGLLTNPFEFHLNAITGDGQGRIFIAGEGGMMFRSLDGGLSWEHIEPVYEGSLFGAIYDSAHDVLLACGLQGRLFRSLDFGATWEPVDSQSSITLAGGSANNGRIVIVGGVGTVLTSDDGGETFQSSMIEDRLSLSSGMNHNGRLVLIGQGGVKLLEVKN